ncbi:MAG: hypothetical protein EBQ80_06360 [Proteobacteria bacterium]|nr:hypothetical protein [Pseudomonadota bacterium]
MLRDELVKIALSWQDKYGVAPAITSAISEYDAAVRILKMSEDQFSDIYKKQTAVTKGHDFIYRGIRYQVKANRPSGKKGSPVTLVGKAKNLDWDKLIWILYYKNYSIQEAWEWDKLDYERDLFPLKRLSPQHMRKGKNVYS